MSKKATEWRPRIARWASSKVSASTHTGCVRVEHEAGLRGEARAGDGNVDRARPVPGQVGVDGPHVEELRVLGRDCELLRERRLADERPRFVSTMRARFGGFGALIAADSATNSSTCGELQRRVEAALEPDRGRRLRAHRLAAERAGDVAGEHLDAVGELEQPAQRVEEPLGALDGSDREVGPGGVADEEGVAGEHEPGLVAARVVDDGEAAVLGPVAGRVDDARA